MFGQPSEDDGSRDNPLIRNMPACTAYEVDADALAPLGDRVVIAVGTGSADGAAARGGRTARRLGLAVADFPGDHGSFFDSSYGEATGRCRGRRAAAGADLLSPGAHDRPGPTR